MQDTSQTTGQIVIAGAGNSFWLLQGEDHLGALLEGSENYPTPVLCARFASVDDLDDLLASEDTDRADLWEIQSAIITRLGHRGELQDLVSSVTA